LEARAPQEPRRTAVSDEKSAKCSTSPSGIEHDHFLMTQAKVISDQAAAGASLDRIHARLMGLGPRLRAHAASHGITVAEALRTVLAQGLKDDASFEVREPELSKDQGGAKEWSQVCLRLPSAPASLLSSRARAAGVCRSRYVALLLAGEAPAPLTKDYGPMVSALRFSTDRIAALSVDIHAFMRLLGRVPSPELEAYRKSIQGLTQEVRAHLELAATLLAAIDGMRRPE
jgi:hypothetical protein